MCACGTEVETTEHFLMRCQFHSTQILELFENLKKIECKESSSILLYDSQTNNS